MKKFVPFGIIAVVVIVAVGATLLFSHKASAPENKSTAQNMDMNGKDGPGAGSPTETTNAISIQNFAFTPSSTTVKVGTTITWTNKDSVAHTVTTSDGPEQFDSGSIAPGKTYNFTVTKAGEYKYHCSFHPSMSSGVITVTE